MRQSCGAALIAACCAVLPAGAEVTSGDALEIIEMMIGQQPSRYDNPLAAMKGEGALYDRLKSGAGTAEGAGLWLLFGQSALMRANGALSGAFTGDIGAQFSAAPEVMLGALAQAPWLVPSTCYFLGAGFDFEGRGGEGRAAFLEAQTGAISDSLAEPLADACLKQIQTPERPFLN